MLAKVSRLVGGRLRMKLEKIGLPHAQGMILFHLWKRDGIPQNVLAQALSIRPSTATNTLQRMQRDGWVERRRDATDQRIVRVHLTDKAKVLDKEAQATLEELDQELTSVLTDQQRDIFMAILSKVYRCLRQMEYESVPFEKKEQNQH
jgi:DNA-binding MarR family transcriptional regulator